MGLHKQPQIPVSRKPIIRLREVDSGLKGSAGLSPELGRNGNILVGKLSTKWGMLGHTQETPPDTTGLAEGASEFSRDGLDRVRGLHDRHLWDLVAFFTRSPSARSSSAGTHVFSILDGEKADYG